MSLGRYRSQYERPEFHPRVPHLRRARRLRPDDGLINIAEPVDVHGPDDVCTVRVYCRPKTEQEYDGNTRLWGVKNDMDNAIIPFEFTARLNEGRIRHLEFDIKFKSGQEASNTGLSASEEDDVRLVAVPAPRTVHGRSSSSQEGSNSWKLSSEPLFLISTSCYASGAKWTWVANGHDSPPYLHGAVVVKHSGSPFALTCKARGSLDIPFWEYWPKIAFRYSFSNDLLNFRWWQLTPQAQMCSEEEFRSAVDGLNATCERLNLRDGSTLNKYGAEPYLDIASQAQVSQTSTRSYSTVHLRDSTSLHQGDNVRHNVQFVYNP